MTSKRKFISKILSSALKFWLQLQLDKCEDLFLAIDGNSRQLFSGYIPKVLLNASRAVYQGIHLDSVELTGENIRINLGDILKGKPLRLLETIDVFMSVVFEEVSLNSSFQSPLLSQGLGDFLAQLYTNLSGDSNSDFILENYQVSDGEIFIKKDSLRLKLLISQKDNESIYTGIINTNLAILNGHILVFQALSIQGFPFFEDSALENFQIDLGDLVDITEFKTDDGKISCAGNLKVMPEVD